VAFADPEPTGESIPNPGEVRPAADRNQQNVANAPDPKQPSGGNVLVPLLLYTPETHFGAGALFVHFFHLKQDSEESRTSSLAIVAIGTTRRQVILELHPDFYVNSDSLHFFGKLEYQYFPDSFWGIGNNTRDADEERYKRVRARFRGGAQQRIMGAFYAGGYSDIMEYWGQYSTADGIFATQEIPGESGGFTAGIGPMLTLDTRDHNVAARSGSLLNGTFLWFGNEIGSNYAFTKLSLDARQFITLTGEHVLGLHLLTEHQRGNVPYYQLAMLGGDELLRGYYLGRYRDKNLAALDLEYRFPIYWRFSGVTFAGAGAVSNEFGGLFTAPVRWTVGGGLRFSLNQKERLNLRLDAGIGPGTFGVYFTAREAF
jgi:hypothetical protein